MCVFHKFYTDTELGFDIKMYRVVIEDLYRPFPLSLPEWEGVFLPQSRL